MTAIAIGRIVYFGGLTFRVFQTATAAAAYADAFNRNERNRAEWSS